VAFECAAAGKFLGPAGYDCFQVKFMRLMKKIAGVLFAVALTSTALANAPMGIMVPSYFVPGPKWDAMDYAASRIPLIAIMNPNSGPGSSQSSSYVSALAKTHAAGGKVIGYVSSSYGSRDINLVKADIDAYVAWYAVDGFFIDEMANDSSATNLTFYGNIYSYIKGKNPQYTVTGNPGVNTLENYVTQPAADSLMIFENDGSKYAGFTPSSWVTKYSPDHFVHLPYNVTNITTMSNYVSLAASRNAGWVYISDLTVYSALPTYWTNEVDYIQSLNAGTPLPVITDPTQPADQTANLGAPVTFQIAATGQAPLTYQWFLNGSAIANATNASYAIASFQGTDIGSYYVRVSNTNGAVSSRTASLNVRPNTYKHITIDGSFDDWAGIPVAYTQAQDTTNAVAYKEVYLANDDDYLYVRFTIYGPPTNAFTSLQNCFINADNNLATGYSSHGTASELLVQAGAGYQQKAGVFNAGAINGLNWAGLPSGAANEFEFRVSLHATNASDNTPVFTSNGVSITLESDQPGYIATEWFPPSGGGVPYTFATQAGAAILNPNQPADQVVVQGRPVTLNVVASGSPALQYQWFKGANSINGATNSTYTIASADPTNSGNYSVTVSNPSNSASSRVAALTVLPDTIAPAVTNISATSQQIVITFSEPVDPVSAGNIANYALTGGINVTGAVVNGQTVTLTTDAPLGVANSLSISGVSDPFGNAANLTVSVAPAFAITIDGSFNDWAGIAPVYSGPSGTDGAADFKDIYVFNDDNYYYFRVTLWHDVPSSDGFFPRRANLHFDTDNNGATGYHPAANPSFGSEFLMQTGYFYQEKGGAFNEGQVLVGMAAGYLIAPTTRETTFPADFEFRLPRNATFSAASGGGLVFSTNVLRFYFEGNDVSYTPRNFAPTNSVTTDHWISYTNVPTTTAPLPIGSLAMNAVPGGKVALVWDPPGMLQCRGSLTTDTWTNLPMATSPYVIPTDGNCQFFRLAH
jgi:hypothetical protein